MSETKDRARLEKLSKDEIDKEIDVCDELIEQLEKSRHDPGLIIQSKVKYSDLVANLFNLDRSDVARGKFRSMFNHTKEGLLEQLHSYSDTALDVSLDKSQYDSARLKELSIDAIDKEIDVCDELIQQLEKNTNDPGLIIQSEGKYSDLVAKLFNLDTNDLYTGKYQALLNQDKEGLLDQLNSFRETALEVKSDKEFSELMKSSDKSIEEVQTFLKNAEQREAEIEAERTTTTTNNSIPKWTRAEPTAYTAKKVLGKLSGDNVDAIESVLNDNTVDNKLSAVKDIVNKSTGSSINDKVAEKIVERFDVSEPKVSSGPKAG